MATFVLIHAPLAGPVTWSLVAKELHSKGHEVVVPSLPDARECEPPYWPRYAADVAEFLDAIPFDRPVVLVGHSGAGLLLPLVRQAIRQPATAYIFVDAMVPENGKSALDFRSPEERLQLRQRSPDAFIPPFSEAVLRAVGIEDDSIRSRLISEMRPLPLAVYEEPIPVFEGWPDASCAYIRFTQTVPTAYEQFVKRAQQEGWAYRELNGNHFHMLVVPQAVAETILQLVAICNSG